MACSHLAGFLLSFFAGSKKQAAKGREEAHFGFVQVAYALPFHGASGPTMRGGRRQGAEDDFSRCLSTVGFEGVEGVKGVEVYFFEHEYILGRYTGLGMYHVLFPKQLTVGVLNATLDLAALVLVGVVGFLGSEVVLSPVVSHCLRVSPFMWGVGVGWCGRHLGL